MRVTLDLTDLVQKGQLTQAEADRLKGLGARDTGSLGANVLFGFGAIAVALGAGFFVPTAEAAIVLGVVFFGGGMALILNRAERWLVFAQIVSVIGALAIAGGVGVLTNFSFEAELGLAAGLGVAAALAGSGLLAALAVLVLAAALGSQTAYFFALYEVSVSRPALTIGVMSALALVLFVVSLRVPRYYERTAIIGARTAVLVVNIAFIVGSLFGDTGVNLDALTFVIVWAILLLAVGIWGSVANRPWVVNVCAVFGAIHFYTQWFERLGASPLSILGGGLLLIVFGFGLMWINRRALKPPAAPTPQPA